MVLQRTDFGLIEVCPFCLSARPRVFLQPARTKAKQTNMRTARMTVVRLSADIRAEHMLLCLGRYGSIQTRLIHVNLIFGSLEMRTSMEMRTSFD